MITDGLRQNNLTAPHRSRRPISATLALGLALALIVAAPSALAAPKGKTSGNAPGNFRVTAKTACTVTVAWEPVSFGSADFNYHLSGAYHVTPAILPKTATSHTFTGLSPGNEYGSLFMRRMRREKLPCSRQSRPGPPPIRARPRRRQPSPRLRLDPITPRSRGLPPRMADAICFTRSG